MSIDMSKSKLQNNVYHRFLVLLKKKTYICMYVYTFISKNLLSINIYIK